MQKVIGGILILSATAGAGVVYGNELKRYLRNMVYLRYVFGLIRGEIEYTCAPLPENFFRRLCPCERTVPKVAEKNGGRNGVSRLIRVCEGMEQMYGQVFGNTGIKTGA